MEISKKPEVLTEDSVHIWVADFNNWRGHASEFRGLLSEEEKERLDRLKIEQKQEDYLCSRGILRMILSLYIGENPESLVIRITPSGKPFLPFTGVQFNISHSGDRFICGISLKNQIGIDIQEQYSISSLQRIIENFFSPAEIEYLSSLPDYGLYQEHFFAIWTAKEAYLKAVGYGIKGSFTRLSMLPESVSLRSFLLDHPELDNTPRNWMIRTLDIAQGYTAALAINGTILEINKYDLFPGDINLT